MNILHENNQNREALPVPTSIKKKKSSGMVARKVCSVTLCALLFGSVSALSFGGVNSLMDNNIPADEQALISPTEQTGSILRTATVSSDKM